MVDSFITYLRCELNYSAHTVSAYQSDLQQWIDFATDGRPEELDAWSVTLSDLRLWMGKLAADGLSPRSLRRKAQSLRAFFHYLMRRHGLKSNPAADLVLAKTDRPLPVYTRESEMASILDSAIDTDDFIAVRDRLIVDMLYSTGMRCSELQTLKDSAVNTATGELKVVGKRNKERIIPFGKELADMIDIYRRLRREYVATPDSAPELFVRPDGQPLYRKLIYNVVHTTLEGNTLAERRSPHVLRHSCATDMLNHGADLFSVQQLLGHQSLATTQVYTHITYRDLKNNYQLAHPRALKKGGNHGS